ncbi:MAG: AAA family ATPase [Methylobacter sp.]|nr:AAA family ATPase [Methylobacter sp.]
MQIDKLEIENFKLFAEQEFQFHSSFNLLIGENGSGKTSLLRAVAVALGGWAHAYIKDKNNLRPILNEEIREIEIDKRFDKTKQTSIKAVGTALIVDNYDCLMKVNAGWTRLRKEGFEDTFIYGDIKYSHNPTQYNFNFDKLSLNILNYIETGKSFSLPLIAFYECDRLWLPKNELNLESSAKAKYSRFDPYVDCFHTGADHQAVGEWLLKHELASIQQQKETPILQSIRNAAKAALEGCTGLKFDFEQGRVMIEFEDGHTTPFEHLSDGQRTMLGLFCDLARRAAILNPHLEGDASAKTSGVVLIDELDLHLHPKWQRRIIEDLSRTFPKIQFICTTHSPFLIQSLRKGKLIQLDGDTNIEYHDLSIEDIVENVQGVELPQKSKRYLDMMAAAEAYYKKLHQCEDESDAELMQLRATLEELSIPFSDDPAFVAQLKFERDTMLAEKDKK